MKERVSSTKYVRQYPLFISFAILNCTIIRGGRRRMMKILVVDDESSIRNLIRMQLEMEGYEVLANG